MGGVGTDKVAQGSSERRCIRLMFSDDPIRDYDRHEAEQERRLAKLPVCDDCGEPIQDYYFEIHDDVLCPDCMEAYRKDVYDLD
jgi:formylmethanofuran dehydrogenase subunit E